MKILKKITTKTVLGKESIRGLIKLADGEPVKLYRAYGCAVGKKEGESNYGHWSCLVGDFRAFSFLNGERYASSQLFLPETAQLVVEATLAAEGVKASEFAFDIYVVEDEASTVGYVYQTTPVGEVSGEDPMARIEKLCLEYDAKKEAEAKEAEAEAEPEPAKKKPVRGRRTR